MHAYGRTCMRVHVGMRDVRHLWASLQNNPVLTSPSLAGMGRDLGRSGYLESTLPTSLQPRAPFLLVRPSLAVAQPVPGSQQHILLQNGNRVNLPRHKDKA
eukprot:1143442-Pelagomonas_calceolata.AAC.2